MGSRDKYTTPLACSKCGTKGTAWWSEWDRPTIYSGTGLRLEGLSEGFIEGSTSKNGGKPTILCAHCKTAIS